MHYVLEDNSIANNLSKIYHLYDTDKLFKEKELAPQWINCDLRHFDYQILGKFDAIMLDPPWDIHMTLPYGTL